MVCVNVDAYLWDDAELRCAVCPSAPAGGPPASIVPWFSTVGLFDRLDISRSTSFPAFLEVVELPEGGTDNRRRLDFELPVDSLCEVGSFSEL